MSQGREVTERDEEGIRSIEAAARSATIELVRHGGSVGFASLVDGEETGATVGIVMVCLDPSKVGQVISFVESLGRFRAKVVQR